MRALICGIGGQDGAYLARHLLGHGYEVFGTSRDMHSATFGNLEKLGIRERVKLMSMAGPDFRSVVSTLKSCHPNEIYNLAGQSSVGLSFDQPAETIESITTATLNLLEAIRFIDEPVRFYNAGSGECYGDTGDCKASEKILFSPTSPYAVAKVAAHHLVATYRNAYGLFACTGILFNHESPLRPVRFVTSKIVDAAVRISRGEPMTLSLGNIDIVRDWGWAEEYTQAMHLMLQQAEPVDYVIASGKSYTLAQLVEKAFQCCGLDWREHVNYDQSLLRPADHKVARADPSLARDKLGWSANRSMPQVIEGLVADRQLRK